jgi:hypothetical protein
MGQQAMVNMLTALVPRDLSSHTWACVAWGAVGLAMFPLLFVVGVALPYRPLSILLGSPCCVVPTPAVKHGLGQCTLLRRLNS